MDELSQIELKYDFNFPVMYRSFVDHGYMGGNDEEYLWLPEAEWLPPAKMHDQGGFWGNPKPGLVAFAFSGGRDLWAWQTMQKSNEGEPLIAYCPRDSYEGWWHAPSLLGWLYRLSLEYASSMWHEESETRANLHRWALVLREFGRPEWSNIVQSVAAQPVVYTRFGSREQDVESSLIGKQEVNDRVVDAFGPGFIDSPYIWNLEGEPANPR